MLTDNQRDAMRRPFLAAIDALMKPGTKSVPGCAGWCSQKRAAFFANQSRVPGDGEWRSLRRMQVAAGLRPKDTPFVSNAAKRAAERAADHHPEASAPAGLQGSRKETPMAAWLITGQGLPLRPPPRRQAVGR